MFSFDATKITPSNSFDPIPPSQYNAMITDAVLKPTKAGTGTLMALTFEILEDNYKGRKVFTQINIQNPNPTAERIGHEELAGICNAINKLQLSDPAEMLDIPLAIKVTIEQDAGYEPRNRIKGYSLLADIEVTPRSNANRPSNAPGAPTSDGSDKGPPWTH